jgi:hypothetical protein
MRDAEPFLLRLRLLNAVIRGGLTHRARPRQVSLLTWLIKIESSAFRILLLPQIAVRAPVDERIVVRAMTGRWEAVDRLADDIDAGPNEVTNEVAIKAVQEELAAMEPLLTAWSRAYLRPIDRDGAIVAAAQLVPVARWPELVGMGLRHARPETRQLLNTRFPPLVREAVGMICKALHK